MASLMFKRQQRKLLLIFAPIFLFLTYTFYYITQNLYQVRNLLSYSTRPIWDSPDGPKEIIPHYYAEGMGEDEYTCKLHGWTKRENIGKVKVLDAVLMSSEIELLEIRMNELADVVDRFFIIESDVTFTGLPKERYFAKNREKFQKFDKKISYRFLPGRELIQRTGQDPDNVQEPFKVEAATRDSMSSFIRSHLTELTPETKALVIMSDVDEIPRKSTIRVLKNCDFGDKLHLQMRNYVYSFEWFIGMTSWRPSIHLWGPGTFYTHAKTSDRVLADAGWHCSYCFRSIKEYQVKMQGFSHNDRIGGRLELLDNDQIQDKICKGKDIFDMLPEAYNYVDFFTQLNLVPQTSMVGLPKFLLRNAERFKFLLPGGCQREIIADDIGKLVIDESVNDEKKP